MSTLDPLESKQCPDACPTGLNRLRCYVSKAWCKVLKVFEPLCALRDAEFSSLELIQANAVVSDVHAQVNKRNLVGISEQILTRPTTRVDYEDWLETCQMSGYFIFNQEEIRLGRGQLTGFNIIGLAMSYGTTCHCCLGWRAIALGVIGFVAGALIF